MFGFGKKIEIEIRGEDGQLKKVKIAKRDFDRWVAEGKVQQVSCQVHILDVMSPYRVETWRIGEDVPQTSYEKFKDENGDLYLSIHYEDSEPRTNLVRKPIWNQMKQATDQIEGVRNGSSRRD